MHAPLPFVFPTRMSGHIMCVGKKCVSHFKKVGGSVGRKLCVIFLCFCGRAPDVYQG